MVDRKPSACLRDAPFLLPRWCVYASSLAAAFSLGRFSLADAAFIRQRQNSSTHMRHMDIVLAQDARFTSISVPCVGILHTLWLWVINERAIFNTETRHADNVFHIIRLHFAMLFLEHKAN